MINDQNAVSVINDSSDEFPVLKAFQQYIDAEQAKARKRMLIVCAIFGILLSVFIIIFLIMFNGMHVRNQMLNERLLEYVMKDRERPLSVAVQQPPTIIQQPTIPAAAQQVVTPPQPTIDNTALQALTQKLESLQNKLAEQEQQTADMIRQKTADQAENARLKALLDVEREKAKLEQERKHQEEIEAYRRRYYPELYAPQPPQPTKPAVTKPVTKPSVNEEPSEEDEIDTIIHELEEIKDLETEKAISYFDNDDEELPKQNVQKQKPYTIPVDIKGKRTNWRIPLE